MDWRAIGFLTCNTEGASYERSPRAVSTAIWLLIAAFVCLISALALPGATPATIPPLGMKEAASPPRDAPSTPVCPLHVVRGFARATVAL